MNKMGGDNRLTTFLRCCQMEAAFLNISTLLEAMASVAWWQLIYDKVRI